MKGSTVSRRVREFVGVALFFAALFWVVSLATYDASDPVWFFSTGQHNAPVNFTGRVGAFLAELSFQLVGYSAYVIPVMLVLVGWHYFWCRTVDAAGTKVAGSTLLFACFSTLLALVVGTVDLSGHPFRAGGYAGEWLAGQTTEYFNRTGSIIIVLTCSVLAIIISTQFSFGRFFAASFAAAGRSGRAAVTSFRSWLEERRRDRQRREVIAKHTKNGAPAPDLKPAAKPIATSESTKAAAKRPADDAPLAVSAPAVSKPAAPVRPPKVTLPTPPLPLSDPEPTAKAPAERRKGEYPLPPMALLDAPRTERKIDERELMDGARLLEEKCREFAVEGNVVQIHPGPVVTTYEFKPDAGVKYSKITGLSEDLCLASTLR